MRDRSRPDRGGKARRLGLVASGASRPSVSGSVPANGSPAPGRPHAGRPRATDLSQDRGSRRRASRSLWAACEALLSAAGPRALARALDSLVRAFDCDGVALHVLGPAGELEAWCARGAWRARPGDLRDCLSVPLQRGDERIGALDLRARAGQVWRPAQLGLIRTAAGALGAALGARLELQRLRNQPGRDPVTGLPDGAAFRTRLDAELKRSTRHGTALGLVVVDLDHFGALNARYGRGAGDRVLAETALVLRLALRESDSLARHGGDGFGILLPEADLASTRRCGERLRRAVEEHRFTRVGRVSASFGVVAAPRCAGESLELLANADQALELAKKSGRRRVASFPQPRAH